MVALEIINRGDIGEKTYFFYNCAFYADGHVCH